MNRVYTWIALAVVAVVVGGYFGATPLAKYLIENNFNEISVENRIADYLRKSGDALSQIEEVSLGISVSVKTLKQIFDVGIDDALTKLSSRPVHTLLGAIEFRDHSLTLSAEPMAIAVRGNVELVLTDYEVLITSFFDIRVLARIEGDRIVYVPALANIDILDIDVAALAWWPFSLVDAANHALSLSIGAINGAIEEQRQAVPALSLLEQKEGFSFKVLEREVVIKPPRLGPSVVLIDEKGVVAIGEVFPADKTRSLATSVLPPASFSMFRDVFTRKLNAAAPELVPGEDWAWVSEKDLQDIVLDDTYTPLPAQEATARVLGGVETRLERITDPTFVFSADSQTVKDAIEEALANTKILTSATGHTFRFKETPMVTLGDGALEARASVVISGPGIEIEATLSGISGLVLSGRSAYVTGALKTVIFEKVVLTEPPMDRWPIEAIARMAKSFADSTLPAINGLMSDHPVRLPIEPLVIAGEPTQQIDLRVADRKVSLPGLMVEDWAAVIHPSGLIMVAQIVPFRSNATAPEKPAELRTSSFDDVMTLMKERAAEIDPDFDVNRAGFRLSGDMLRNWLAPISVPIDLTQVHKRTIQEAHQELNRIEGPDVAFSVPSGLIREIATARIAKHNEALAALGLTVEPESVVLSFGDQAVNVTFPFRYEKDFVIEGHAAGRVLAGYAASGPAFRVFVQEIRIDTLSLTDTNAFDTNGFAGSVALLLDELLPIVNGALDALEVKIEQPKPYEVDFGPHVSKIEGLTVSPETFTIPAPAIPRPLLLIADDRVAIIADFKADYLSKRTIPGGSIVDATNPTTAFAAYRADFQGVWKRKFDWPATAETIHVKASTSRIAETLESLWRLAEVKMTFKDQYRAISGRQPVAAIPPKPSCGRGCDRPACDRNRACPPRRECKEVSELVTVPTTIVKEVCEPATSIINKPVKEIREVCEKLPWPLDLLCEPIEVIEHVQEEVTEIVCKTVEVVEDIQKRVTTEICEEAVDTACLVTLDKCVLKWAEHDVCSLPFKVCTEMLRTVTKSLQAFDFDKFGYASAETNIGLSVDIDATSALDVGDDLRTVVLLPNVIGNVSVNARVKFEPRASVFLACAPFKPLQLRNYRLKLGMQTLRVRARITPTAPARQGNRTNVLGLVFSLDPITVSGKFSQAPLTKLFMDNPTTLLTCPVVPAGAAVSEMLGSTSLTRDALEKAAKEIAGKKPADVARLLLDGIVTRQVRLPSSNVSVPSMTLEFGSRVIEFAPRFLDREITFTSR